MAYLNETIELFPGDDGRLWERPVALAYIIRGRESRTLGWGRK
jgi:hypothetical protein